MHESLENALTRNQDTTALDKKYKTTAQCSHKNRKKTLDYCKVIQAHLLHTPWNP